MSTKTSNTNKRLRDRTKAVLPVRLKGTDVSGNAFEELAHTLDVTSAGVRLGAVRRELNLSDEILIQFRQRRMMFRVVWIKKLKNTSEFQVGLEAITQEREAWGVTFEEPEVATPTKPEAMAASGSA